jgi:hypothetical protein
VAISIAIEGLDNVLGEILDQLQQLNAKIDALNSDSPWLNTKSAARFLDTTEIAIRSLVRSGKLEAHHNGAGKLMIARTVASEFAVRNGLAQRNGR